MAALTIVVVVVALIALAWFSYAWKRRRRMGLASFAQKFHFEFEPRDPFNLLWDYNLPLFEMGDGRGTENVLWGEWDGVPFRETDYWYYTKASSTSGDDPMKSYKHFNAVVIDVPAYLPKITIERENIGTRLAGHVGAKDIQFESGEFNRTFGVMSDDRAFAFKLIDARMMHWLLSTDERFGFQCYAGAILAYTRRLKPAQLLPLIGTAKEMFDHSPHLVWADYGSGPAPTAGTGR